MKVRGDGVEVDTTGSSAQVPTAFNVPFDGSTKVACYFAFRALLLDTYTRGISAERGLVPAGQGDVAAGLDLQPDLAGRRRGALQPDPAACDLIIKALAPVLPGKMHGRQRGGAVFAPIPACGLRATGCSSKSTRPRWAAGRCRTDRIRSRS